MPKNNTDLPQVGKNAKRASGVNIIRSDYLLDKKVIFATARAKRPDQFSRKKEVVSDEPHCPFCPHNQDKIIVCDEIPAPRTKYGWAFRSLENLFGILTPQGKIPIFDHKSGFFEENAYGHAEVIVETPKHGLELEDMPKNAIANLLQFIARRVDELNRKEGVRYVSVFKNRGREAGASIAHTHTQIITTPFVPKAIAELLEANYRYVVKHGHSPFAKIIEEERKSKRFVFENDHIICFTPYASQTPFELWIFPKRQVPSITLLNEGERVAFEEILRKAIKQLNTLGTPPYNLLFMNDHEYGELHFHIKLHPRLTTPPAGFEFITGLAVNPLLPEDAATFYKKGF